jgi:hypothetical protein
MTKKPVTAVPKEVASVRLNADVKAAIEQAAEDEERTVSWLVNKILTEWLKAKKYLK